MAPFTCHSNLLLVSNSQSQRDFSLKGRIGVNKMRDGKMAHSTEAASNPGIRNCHSELQFRQWAYLGRQSKIFYLFNLQIDLCIMCYVWARFCLCFAGTVVSKPSVCFNQLFYSIYFAISHPFQPPPPTIKKLEKPFQEAKSSMAKINLNFIILS